MKYLMIIMLAFVMSFSVLGSSMLADADLSLPQSVEIVVDASEAYDAEEPTPSDESKHFVVSSRYDDVDERSSFQRVAFDYSYEQNLTPNKPPQS